MSATVSIGGRPLFSAKRWARRLKHQRTLAWHIARRSQSCQLPLRRRWRTRFPRNRRRTRCCSIEQVASDANSIVQRALGFINHHLVASTNENRDRLARGTVFNDDHRSLVVRTPPPSPSRGSSFSGVNSENEGRFVHQSRWLKAQLNAADPTNGEALLHEHGIRSVVETH